MFKKKTLPMGMLTMVLIIGVALAGVGYALWSETLTIGGTVTTGEVDVALIDMGKEECVDTQDGLCQDEPAAKDYAATCDVVYSGPDGDSTGDDGADQLQVTVNGIYPSYHCKANFQITNLGNVPVHVRLPEPTSDIPAWVSTNLENCYVNDNDYIQLEQGESTDTCTMDIHFTNETAPDENSTFTFGWTILAHQWNEDPPVNGPIVDPEVPPVDEYIKGFADRYRAFTSPAGEQENYLGVGNVGDDNGITGERVGNNIEWGTGNSIEFIYDADLDTLVSNVNTGSNTYTLPYENLTSQLLSLGNGCEVSDVDFMILSVVGRDPDSTVDFNNVVLSTDLESYSLGDFSGTGGWFDWMISNFDFSQSFTLSGNLLLSGPFSATDENSKLEMLVVCSAP